MTQILGFAGKAKSGKTSACNWLFSIFLSGLGYSEGAGIDKKGNLVVTLDGKDYAFDWRLRSNDLELAGVFKVVKIYALADPVKTVCMQLFGLTWDQCYGSKKNTFSKLTVGDFQKLLKDDHPLQKEEPKTRLSARRVLQLVAHDIFRTIYYDVWIDKLLSRIEKDQPELALVEDIRYQNEILKINKNEGKVVKLLRESEDNHASENDLIECPDDYFAKILDNQELSLSQKNKEIYDLYKELEMPYWQELP